MGSHVPMLFSKPWVHSMWVVHRVGMVGLQNQRFLICGSQYLIGLLLVKTDLLLTPCSDTTSTSCFNASYQTDQHRYQQILFCARSHEIFQSNQFSANRMVADDGILCLTIFWVLWSPISAIQHILFYWVFLYQNKSQLMHMNHILLQNNVFILN